jgi:hypothetical protein
VGISSPDGPPSNRQWRRGGYTAAHGEPIVGRASRTAAPPSRARYTEQVGRSGMRSPSGRPTRQKRESADKPGSVVGNHPSGAPVTVRLERPTRKPLRAAGTSPKARALPYLVLLQVGFAMPPNVATGAVRSYRTVSPLPASCAPRMTLDRHRRFTFCCTFRGLAPPRRYLAPCPVEPGLSSASQDAAVAWPTPGAIIPSSAALLRCRLSPELQRVLVEFLAAPSRDLCREARGLRDG